VSDHHGQGLSGNGRGTVRARGVGLPRPLSRGGAAEDAAPSAGPLSPLPAGRWLLAVTRVFSTALSRSVRVTRPTVPTIISP
jgi:hypothetical protein